MANEGIQVNITSDGVLSSVKLNGIDLSQIVSSVTFHHEAGCPPTVVLELNAEEVDLKAVVGSVLIKGKAAEKQVSPSL